jgi:hypothetical protein
MAISLDLSEQIFAATEMRDQGCWFLYYLHVFHCREHQTGAAWETQRNCYEP